MKKNIEKVKKPRSRKTAVSKASSSKSAIKNAIAISSDEGISSAHATNETELDLVPGTEADVTKEDLQTLGSTDLNIDMGDDEQLKHRLYPVDFAGADLDVPGAELDDASERIGTEDEENNTYSLGGDKD